jgi:plasmid stabilization system protein ParE
MAEVVWAQSGLRHLREIDDFLSQRSPSRAAVCHVVAVVHSSRDLTAGVDPDDLKTNGEGAGS